MLSKIIDTDALMIGGFLRASKFAGMSPWISAAEDLFRPRAHYNSLHIRCEIECQYIDRTTRKALGFGY